MRDTTTALLAMLRWLRLGTGLFTDRVGALGDEDFAGPSLLPGWSRAHVVSHVACNAAALSNLARWAMTGVETPMYASPGQREADIASGATRAAADIRDHLVNQDRRLAEALAMLDERAWQAQVRTARGREIRAMSIPWLRVREVWIHAVDLDAGATFADLPRELTHVLLQEVAEDFARRATGLAVTLIDGQTGSRWHINPEDPPSAPTTVVGSSCALLGWLLGRTGAEELCTFGPTVTVPRWL